MMILSVTAFVCDGCEQKQIGGPSAALCPGCDGKRKAQLPASASEAQVAAALIEGIEVTMRAWVDMQVLTGAMKIDLAHALDKMIDRAVEVHGA